MVGWLIHTEKKWFFISMNTLVPITQISSSSSCVPAQVACSWLNPRLTCTSFLFLEENWVSQMWNKGFLLFCQTSYFTWLHTLINCTLVAVHDLSWMNHFELGAGGCSFASSRATMQMFACLASSKHWCLHVIQECQHEWGRAQLLLPLLNVGVIHCCLCIC